MTRLEEADEIISKIVKGHGQLDDIDGLQEACVYHNNYLKPKDPLFEKYAEWCKETGRVCVPVPLNNDSYVKFLKIFKEELNGTKGLDEAFNSFSMNCYDSIPSNYIRSTIKKIKERLEEK